MKKIILGTMQFYWTSDKEQAVQVLDQYYDSGGREIDTADIYPNWVGGLKGGETEELIGKWLKGKKREEIFLTSKVRGKVWEGEDGEGSLAWLLSKDYISGVLVGADTKDQIIENYQALDVKLETQDIQMLDEISLR